MWRTYSKRDFSEVDEGWLVSYADLITLLFIFFALMLSISTVSKSKFEFLSHQMNRGNHTRLADLKAQLDRTQGQLKTQLTEEGLEVQFEEGLLFSPGDSKIGERGRSVLENFLKTLAPLKSSYYFAIEGHTDSRPIHTNLYTSNWSLSAARAVEVLHFFTKRGVPEKQMMVRAYAATRPARVPIPLRVLGEGDQETRDRRVTVLVYQ